MLAQSLNSKLCAPEIIYLQKKTLTDEAKCKREKLQSFWAELGIAYTGVTFISLFHIS